MFNKQQISLVAELESLPVFRDFIKSVCNEQSGIDSQTCYDLQLAVDEACTNIMEHGYAGINPGLITLTIEADSNQIVINITDFGHPIEPRSIPKPDVQASLDDRPLGGLGLFFIYQSMDVVHYEVSEAGNCLKLVKRYQEI